MLKAVIVAVFTCGLNAQTLRVMNAGAAPGETASVEIFLESTETARPAALEWTMVVPTKAQGVEIKAPVIGAAAKDSGKLFACSGHWKKAPSLYAYHCIVAGGNKVLLDGPMAVVELKILPQAKPGVHSLEIEGVKAVNASAAPVRMKSVSGQLAVRGR